MTNPLIAIIYEGMKTEKGLWSNIKEVFPYFKGDSIEIYLDVAYGGNIYDLYSSINSGGEVDTIALIQERINNSQDDRLKRRYANFLKHNPSEFSEIYMFFDADLHHTIGTTSQNYDDNRNILLKMVRFFNNESGYGKLYISYPMIEAIKDIGDKNICYDRCFIKYTDMVIYKRTLQKINGKFLDVRHYGLLEWKLFCRHALFKANCIVNGKYSISSYQKFLDELTQDAIARKQIEISKIFNGVYVLSGVPFFILEYFGQNCWDKDGILSFS